MDEYFEDYFVDDSFEQQHYSWLHHCLLPTLTDAFHNFFLPILLTNLVAKFVTLLIDVFVTPRAAPRLSSLLSYVVHILSGVWLLTHHLKNENSDVQLFVWIALISSIVVNSLFVFLHTILSSKWTSFLSFCFFTLQFCVVAANETLIHVSGRNEFLKLRPLIMVGVMKSVAFLYESTKSARQNRSWSAVLDTTLHSSAYLLHPASIVLGVWHPQNILSSSASKSSLTSSARRIVFVLMRTFKCVLFSFAALTCSSCAIEYLEKEVLPSIGQELSLFLPTQLVDTADVLFSVYFIALRFHCSHFFICFAAESMFTLWEWDAPVTKPQHILLPYSMVQVVVSWNIPMHLWLKRYVFKRLYRRFSTTLTILFTYLISSYLHGLNCQIWSVLLTLGICTQIEYKFRSRIAQRFSACVGSRPCKQITVHRATEKSEEVEEPEQQNESPLRRRTRAQTRAATAVAPTKKNEHPNARISSSSHANPDQKCSSQHSLTSSALFSRVTNLLFSFIVVANLAFLGSTFDGDPESASCANVRFIWSHLYYYPYIISAIQLVYLCFP